MNAFIRVCGVLYATALLSIAIQGASGPVISSKLTSNSQVEVSWTGENFSLEKTLSLTGPASWQPVSQAPVQQGTQFTLTLVASEAVQFLRLRGLEGANGVYVFETSPANTESGVAVTRETVLRFSDPLGSNAVLDVDRFHAFFGNRRLLTRSELSSDRRTATLFYLENLPAGARIEVDLDGNGLTDGNGRLIDAEHDGIPGGVFTMSFQTAGNSPLPNTGVIGHVYASERSVDGTDHPLEGAIVTVDGAEETLRAVTDTNGFFYLSPAPGGRFFVHVDGRTAVGSSWPHGAYYPFVGKAWKTIPGDTNNLAGGTGLIYLPLVPADTLQPVSATVPTVIQFPAAVIATNAALAGVTVTVPPNALFSENGTRGGKLGIAPVPPDRLPEPLPAGLNLPLVITIQTDGPMNFDQPVPVRFPNLPDPITGVKLPPGAKTVLWSFNHDTGRWEPQGTATITADGNYAETDPGVGIRQPGWHGVGTGTPAMGPDGEGDNGPQCGAYPAACCGSWEDLKKPCVQKQELAENAIFDLAVDDVIYGLGGPGGCGLGTLLGSLRAERDCAKVGQFSGGCGDIVQSGVIGTALGCIPIVGGVAGLGWGVKGVIDGAFDYKDCIAGVVAACGGSSLRALDASAGKNDPRLDHAIASLELQIRFSETASNALVRILGDPVWAQVPDPSLLEPYRTFMTTLDAALKPASSDGTLVSPSERAAILALPMPNGASAVQATALIDRLEGFGHELLKTNETIRAQVEAGLELLVNITEDAIGNGWSDPLDGVRQAAADFSSMWTPKQETVESLSFRIRAQASDPYSFPARALYYLLLDTQTGFTQRGRLSPTGRFEGIILRPSATYAVVYFDPLNRRSGAAFFQSQTVGLPTHIPTTPLLARPASDPDTDADGIPDSIEKIVGTDPSNQDTDGDAISDGVEIFADSNPLDGIAGKVGIVASIALPSAAEHVKIANDIAIVAERGNALSIIDIRNPVAPVLITRYPTSSAITGFALQSPFVLLGTTSETTLLDLSDPVSPKSLWSTPGRSYSFALGYGNAIASITGLNVFAIDNGERVPGADIPDNAYFGLQILGDKLYSARTSVSIFDIKPDGSGFSKIHDIPGIAGAFFIEPDYAYLAQSIGYSVADISDPANPVTVGQSGLGTRGNKAITKDSADRLLVISSTSGSQLQIGVLDQSDPTITTNYLGGFTLDEGDPMDLVIYRGRAFIAGGSASRGNFSVLNYRTADFGTNAPTVQLRVYADADDPPVEQSSGWFHLSALAKDDVVVRNVEFFLDDLLVADDGSHPFDADLRAPAFTPQKSSFTVRARAFDTAGNSTWSAPITVGLTNEYRPPRLLSFSPSSGLLGLTGSVFTVSARFDEPLLSSTLNTGFVVTSAGLDTKFNTADDQAVPFTVTAQASNLYVLNLSQPLPPALYRVTASTNLTDLFDNRLANPTQWVFGPRVPLHWIGGNGLWSDAAHWSEPRIPNAFDIVRIDPSAPATISFGQKVGIFDYPVYELTSEQPVVFGRTLPLKVGSTANFKAPVTIGNVQDTQSGLIVQGGESHLSAGVDINGTLTLQDHTLILDSPGNVSHIGNYNISLSESAQHLGSHFIIEQGSTIEVTKSGQNGFAWSTLGDKSSFINRGIVRKLGAGIHYLQGYFQNQGTLLIEEGTLNTSPFAPLFENLGVIDIRAGATFLAQNGSSGQPVHYARTASFIGSGTNHLDESANLDCEYTFEGTTVLSGGSKEFRGGVRNTGPWEITGGSDTVSGLFADFAGPVTLGATNGSTGSLTLKTASEAVLHDLRVIAGNLQGIGRARILSPMTITNDFRLLGFTAPFTVRFDGPVNLQGVQAGNAYLKLGSFIHVEFANDVHWIGGPVQLSTNCVVLPGVTFFAESAIGSTNLYGETDFGISIRGTYKQNGAGTNRIQRIVNSGLVEVSAGVLESRPASAFGSPIGFIQTAGELRLAGGTVNIVAGGFNSTSPGELKIDGGAITGSGEIFGNITLSKGSIKPGLPIGAINIHNDLIVGTNGVIVVDIGGTEPGVTYDHIQCVSADIRGRLEINLANNFSPQIGQEFTILSGFGIQNHEFVEIIGQDIGGGKRFDPVYEQAAFKLRVVAVP